MSRAVAGLVVIPTMMSCGFKQTLTDMTDSLIPVTPGEAARMMLDPHDPDNRREGLLLISNAIFGGEETYVLAYRDYAEHEHDPVVKAVAIRALGRHGMPEDALLVSSSLGSPHVQVRWEAAKTLQRLHNLEVVTDLVRVVQNENEESEVRVAGADALGQYSEDRVFQALISALDARELSINIAAAQSLKTLTGQEYEIDARRWLSWYNSTNEPFAGQLEYRYPTYQRDPSLLEKLAFWSNKTYEQPGLPAGLRAESMRQTYSDADATDTGVIPDEGG